MEEVIEELSREREWMGERRVPKAGAVRSMLRKSRHIKDKHGEKGYLDAPETETDARHSARSTTRARPRAFVRTTDMNLEVRE